MEGARSTWPFSFCSSSLCHRGFTSCDTHFGDLGNSSGRGVAEANIVGCPHERSLAVTQITKGVVEPLCTIGSWDLVQLEDLATVSLPLRALLTVGGEVLVHVVLTLRLLRPDS